MAFVLADMMPCTGKLRGKSRYRGPDGIAVPSSPQSWLLALLPGQAMIAPPAHGAPLFVAIQRALETLLYIDKVSITVFSQRLGCRQ